MKRKANNLSSTGHGSMVNQGTCAPATGIFRGKGEVLNRSKDSVFIRSFQMPKINLNEVLTCGLWRSCKHPEFSLLSPMSFEKNVEIIKKILNRVIEGHVFTEGDMLRGEISYAGKPVNLGFMSVGSKSKALCRVFFFDEQDKYIGFPTQEQIDWIGKQ